MTDYQFAETDAETRKRHDSNAAGMDVGTFDLFDKSGVSPGWLCAEVGAGPGTVARWLAERIGPTGHLLATDIDTRWLGDLATSGAEVRTEDITTDALGHAEFDLVHARTVLTHLRDWAPALDNLMRAVRPGGWILLEEPDQRAPYGRTAPDEPAFQRIVNGIRRIQETGGGDPDFGARLPVLIRNFGLVDMGVHVRVPAPGERQLVIDWLDSAHDVLTSVGGVREDDIDTVRTFLRHPANLLYGTLIVAAWGRKPA
jgi:SAM-dependent methyltransferase